MSAAGLKLRRGAAVRLVPTPPQPNRSTASGEVRRIDQVSSAASVCGTAVACVIKKKTSIIKTVRGYQSFVSAL